MGETNFIRLEVAAALSRGIEQCVVIAPDAQRQEALRASPKSSLQVFVVDEGSDSDTSAIFVPTQFGSETLAAALAKSKFDKRKPSLFVWLGGAGYRALDAVLGTLGFIASLPKGTGVLFDYVTERTAVGAFTTTALDALASRIGLSDETVEYLIQPQAVAALLSGLGFKQIADFAKQELLGSGGHLVSAIV